MRCVAPLDVVIIGAGIAGAATAVELARDGHHVTIVEPGDPGGVHAASYGNAGWLSPASVVPNALPGVWKQVPGFLANPLGPLAVRSSYAVRALPWLARYVHSGSDPRRVVWQSRAMRALVADAPERHVALAEAAGVGYLIRRGGLLYAFPSRAEFVADALAWQLRRDCGVAWTELDADELRSREPALSQHYGFAVFVEHGAHCIDPGGYVAALVAYAEALGAQRVRARATGLVIERGRLRGVMMGTERIDCDRAVIAAGAWSRGLAREAGDDVPLETERGYHAEIRDPGFALGHTVMLSDAKMVCTMMMSGLRVAGQVEIAGLHAQPNWRRAEILLDHALKAFPALPRPLSMERARVWMGHRPSMPDSLPCIGLAGFTPDVVDCFGHGHIGLAAGALSGRLAADLVTGNDPVIDPEPYSPARFC